MTKLDESILEPIYDKETTDAAKKLIDYITWLEQELARRYLIGAIKHLDVYPIDDFALQQISIEAKKILIDKFNSITPGFEEYVETRERVKDFIRTSEEAMDLFYGMQPPTE